MARIRTIKPQFFKNEGLAELPMVCRVLYIGIWTQADREGRLEDRPKRLKAEIFPYDNVNVDELLSKLQSAGFIVRYEFGDLKLIYVNNFLKHQCPNQKEPKSELPAPEIEKHHESTVQAQYKDDTGTCGTGKEGNGKEEQEQEMNAESVRTELDDGVTLEVYPTLNDFWDEYDKKVGDKQKIKKKWEGLSQSDREKIMDYIPNYKLSQPDKQYRKNPETFLNNKGWNDELIFKNDGKQANKNERVDKFNKYFASKAGNNTG